MSAPDTKHVTEEEARRVAEDARQKEWRSPSFLKEIFLGNFRFDLIDHYPDTHDEREEFKDFYKKLETFLREKVDPQAIDEAGEYPEEVVDGLRKLGAFGMKIPKEYGGLGFKQAEYDKVMRMLGSWDANICALLSAHQSIGVPQPIKVFGTDEQKKKYLPRCAKGAVSAFALTELDVGSDPARLGTTAELTEDGKEYVINGTKLWCTNGTIAELFVVMAKDPKSKKISAFIVERDMPGVTVEHRCRFMGLRAIENGVIGFKNVKVPVENRVGKEGEGLKIALVTLNTGRLAIPASCVGFAKHCLEMCRVWSKERVQWGREIGKHEAISHMLADMAATTFAMEAISEISSGLADKGGYDIRLEAACAKEYNTCRGWDIIDTAMQIRGGRGYETERSLKERGERPASVERLMRDARINKIFEGSSEIMHLFMAREAVDTHLGVAEIMIDPKKPIGEKLKALPKIGLFYAKWYPKLWLNWGYWPRFGQYGRFAKHLCFVERSTRKLARQIFHGMMVHQAKLQWKQAFLFRVVDIGMELFSMAAAVSRAHHMAKRGDASAAQAAELCDIHCRNGARKINGWFKALWSNDDDRKVKLARQILDGQQTWIEKGTLGLAPVPVQAPAKGDDKPAAEKSDKREPVAV